MATDPRIRYDIEARASGAAEVEKLAREFEQLDGAFPDDLAAKVRTASQQLQELGQQQQAVEAFARIKTETELARKALDDAQAAAQRFGREIAQTEAPTRAQTGQLAKLRDNVQAAKEELLRQTQALDGARAGLTQFGLSGDQVGQRSVQLRQQIAAVRTEIDQLAKTGTGASGFQQLVRDTDAARQRMEQTARAAEALAAELQAVQRPTDGEAAKLRELRAAADTARADFQRLQTATVEQGLALKSAGVNTELLTSKTREAASAQAQAAAAAQRGANAYSEQGAAATRAAQQQTAAATSVNKGLEGIASQIRTIQTLAATVLGGQLLSGTLGDVSRTADAYANLQARIKLVTGEGAALTDAFNGVFDVALRTNSAIEGTGTLFTRIAQAGKDLGLSTSQASAQALQLTETINQAIQVSGGSAQSADAAVTQLIQALQSGVLRGEEFNSVMEQAPRLARALADGLGVTTGELRKLAEAGSLTSAAVISALQGQSAALQREFEQLPPTVGRALTSLSTEWTRYVGEVDKANGISRTAAEGIQALARNLDSVAAALEVAGKAVAAYIAVDLAKSLYARAAAAAAAAAAQTQENLTTVAATQAVAANTTAVVGNTVAKVANTAATAASATANAASALAWGSVEKGIRISGVAAAEAAAKTGALGTAFGLARGAGSALLGAIGGLPTIALAVALNFREVGTWIGESAAKMLGAKDRSNELAEADRKLADEAKRVAVAKAEQAQKAQLATDKALGLTDASKLLVSEFDGLIKKGESVSDALAKISKGLDLGNLDGIRNAITALDALAQQGKITGAQIRESLASALANVDLGVFKVNALAAFDETEQGARRLKEALTAIDEQALRRVGTSVDELKTGFSSAFSSAVNDIDAVDQALKNVGATGPEAGAALEKALDKALTAANTAKAIELVIQKMKELGNEGKLTGDKVAEGTEKAKVKLDELKPGINSTAEAYRTLGIKSREEAQRTADKYGEAYKQIAQDARASIQTKIEAFQKWSAAAIEANGGVESSEVRIQREVLNIQAKAAGLGDAFVDSMTRSKTAIDSTTQALQSQIGSLSSLTDAARKAQGSLSTLGKNVDKNGFATDANGNTISITGQLNIPDGGSFDNAAFQRAQQTAAQSGLAAPNPQNFVVGPSPAIVTKPSDIYGPYADQFNGGAGASPFGPKKTGSSVPAPAPAPKAPSSTTAAPTMVTININGKTSAQVAVATPSDATALESVLRQVADAARSSGYSSPSSGSY